MQILLLANFKILLRLRFSKQAPPPVLPLPLDYLPFLVRYAVEAVDDVVDLFVGYGDLSFDLFALGGRGQGVFLFVEFEHALDEGDDFVVNGLVVRLFEVDGPDGEFCDILINKSRVSSTN